MTQYEVELAPAAAAIHDTVYLATHLPDKPPATYALKILAVEEGRMVYDKIPNQEKYTGASGGPILNEKGQLVGTYTGHSTSNGLLTALFGTPYSTLKTALAGAGP